MNNWLLDNLVCPRDKGVLEHRRDSLACAAGHVYPIFDGVPVMLVEDVEETHGYITRTLEQVARNEAGQHHSPGADSEIDAFVQGEVPYTSGNLYFSIQHKLTRYPIPHLRLPPGEKNRLLDIGCNWGRWTVAAARKGYLAVGIDPSLDAVLAARRVTKQLGVDADFVVGDARFLPFRDSCFDTVFSYGVLQHFSKENARTSLAEAARVLKNAGKSLIQMPNRYGIRQYQQHRRRGFTEGEGFEVRYWTPAELINTFEENFGPTNLSADAFLGLGIQTSDADLLPLHFRAVVYSSEILRHISTYFSPLVKVADSVYLESVNRK